MVESVTEHFYASMGVKPLAWLPDELWRRSRAEYGYIIEITKGRSSGATLSSAFEVKGRAASPVT